MVAGSNNCASPTQVTRSKPIASSLSECLVDDFRGDRDWTGEIGNTRNLQLGSVNC